MKTLYRTSSLVAALALLFILCPHPAAAQDTDEPTDILFSFGDTPRRGEWVSVNDDVMGGRSKGGFEFSKNGFLRFRGTISLENRGGFASIRSRPLQTGLGDAHSLVLRVKGDGRTYHVDLRQGNQWGASSFRTPITPPKGEWTTLRVPLDSFVLSAFGRDARGVRIGDPDAIRSVGFTLNDGKDGAFSLDVEWIGVDRGSPARGGSTIAEIAAADGRFGTLLAAVEAAGLSGALAGTDPLTVFAPTDEAFAKLPDGTVENLLRPENREALTRVLTFHVVPGTIRLSGQSLDTLAGSPISIVPQGLTVEGANILFADIVASNGIIHVIDAVLLPPEEPAKGGNPAREILELAISRGVPLFNRGEVEACAMIYELAAESVLRLPVESTGAEMRAVLERALSNARDQEPRAAAWTLRRAFDRILSAR